MGICASCLGLGRRTSEEPSETEGLLYDDALRPQYGSAAHGPPIPQPDPEELRKERETLERICAETSSELIDVLHHNAFTKGSKMSVEYPHLLSKHFASRDSGSHQEEDEQADEEAWLSGTEEIDRGTWEEVKGFKPGELVISLQEPLVHHTTGKKPLR